VTAFGRVKGADGVVRQAAGSNATAFSTEWISQKAGLREDTGGEGQLESIWNRGKTYLDIALSATVG
jgi:hypothetical protein